MGPKKSITFYKSLDEPYFQAMLNGMKERPEERFIKFFETKLKFENFMGLTKSEKKLHTLTIRKAEWI
jgi:hypothetical protein